MDKFAVILVSHALKFYRKCPADLARRLNACFEDLEHTPFFGANIKVLRNESKLYRYRVGDYRVIYSIDKPARKVVITLISPRQSAYRTL